MHDENRRHDSTNLGLPIFHGIKSKTIYDAEKC